MADLGAVAKDFSDEVGGLIVSMPFPNYAVTELRSALNMHGILGGNVKTAGVNEPNVEVMVMWRPTMKLIARTWTDADGNWTLTGFDPLRSADYAIIYKDPATGAVYNDAIYALVAPV